MEPPPSQESTEQEEERAGGVVEEDGDGVYIGIRGLADLTSAVSFPGDVGIGRICVLGVDFTEAPLLLEQLRAWAASRAEPPMIGNLAELRRDAELSSRVGSLDASVRVLVAGEVDIGAVAAVRELVPRLTSLCALHEDHIIRNNTLLLLQGVADLLAQLDLHGHLTSISNQHQLLTLLTNLKACKFVYEPPPLTSYLHFSLDQQQDQAQSNQEEEEAEADQDQPEAEADQHQDQAQADEEEEDEPYVRIYSFEQLMEHFDQVNAMLLPPPICVAGLNLGSATEMCDMLEKLTANSGWWVGNLDLVRGADELKSGLSFISRYLKGLRRGKNGSHWMKESVSSTADDLMPLARLQPPNVYAAIKEIFDRLKNVLNSLPPEPDITAGASKDRRDHRITYLSRKLVRNIDNLNDMYIEYPDADVPQYSPTIP